MTDPKIDTTGCAERYRVRLEASEMALNGFTPDLATVLLVRHLGVFRADAETVVQQV